MYSHSLRIRVASKVGSVTSYAAILLKQEQNQANKHMPSASCNGMLACMSEPTIFLSYKWLMYSQYLTCRNL